jgi:CRP/FNR family transcriptional regulator
MASSIGVFPTINPLSRSRAMGCVCEELAGKDAGLSPTCIGHLWIFENLKPQELDALSKAALRKKYERGQTIFSQGEPAN